MIQELWTSIATIFHVWCNSVSAWIAIPARRFFRAEREQYEGASQVLAASEYSKQRRRIECLYAGRFSKEKLAAAQLGWVYPVDGWWSYVVARNGSSQKRSLK
jgi:hypothetical protein